MNRRNKKIGGKCVFTSSIPCSDRSGCNECERLEKHRQKDDVEINLTDEQIEEFIKKFGSTKENK